jgi:hypothetical protein
LGPKPIGNAAQLFSSDVGRSDRQPDALTAAALLYLALPNFIFLAGWLRTPYAVLASLVLAAGLASALARARISWGLPHPRAVFLVIVAAGFAWAAFGGAGHLVYANPHDWRVRDALLADLVFGQWPPSYGGTDSEPIILRTALGYFLPAALTGKLFGPALAHLALYVWTGLGTAVFLLLLPLPQRFGGRLLLLLAVVILFSGMDLIGQLLDKGVPKPAEHIEWWSGAFQYSSMSTQLFWVPNHALPAWIATALIYRHWQRPEAYPASILMVALLLIWTPFAAVGVAPFVAFQMANRLRQRQTLFTGIAVLAASATLLYLLGRLLTLDVAAMPLDTPLAGAPDLFRFLAQYVKFGLLEFAILALLLLAVLRHSFGLFWIAFAMLALLPLVRFGPSNDLVMRASIPALVLLLILVLRVLEEIPARETFGAPSLVLATALLVGAFTAFNEFWRAGGLPAWRPSYTVSLGDIARGGMIPNYFGRLDRTDLKVLLKPAARVQGR